jgi:uncharacterized protein (DUF488 family)
MTVVGTGIMTNKIYTLGYENAAIDDFIATLQALHIEKIIDIREYPFSRKKGFSKGVLRALLEVNNIGYVHLKGLGDPKQGRQAARAGDYEEFRRIFTCHMKSALAILRRRSS